MRSVQRAAAVVASLALCLTAVHVQETAASPGQRHSSSMEGLGGGTGSAGQPKPPTVSDIEGDDLQGLKRSLEPVAAKESSKRDFNAAKVRQKKSPYRPYPHADWPSYSPSGAVHYHPPAALPPVYQPTLQGFDNPRPFYAPLKTENGYTKQHGRPSTSPIHASSILHSPHRPPLPVASAPPSFYALPLSAPLSTAYDAYAPLYAAPHAAAKAPPPPSSPHTPPDVVVAPPYFSPMSPACVEISPPHGAHASFTICGSPQAVYGAPPQYLAPTLSGAYGLPAYHAPPSGLPYFRADVHLQSNQPPQQTPRAHLQQTSLHAPKPDHSAPTQKPPIDADSHKATTDAPRPTHEGKELTSHSHKKHPEKSSHGKTKAADAAVGHGAQSESVTQRSEVNSPAQIAEAMKILRSYNPYLPPPLYSHLAPPPYSRSFSSYGHPQPPPPIYPTAPPQYASPPVHYPPPPYVYSPPKVSLPPEYGYAPPPSFVYPTATSETEYVQPYLPFVQSPHVIHSYIPVLAVPPTLTTSYQAQPHQLHPEKQYVPPEPSLPHPPQGPSYRSEDEDKQVPLPLKEDIEMVEDEEVEVKERPKKQEPQVETSQERGSSEAQSEADETQGSSQDVRHSRRTVLAASLDDF